MKTFDENNFKEHKRILRPIVFVIDPPADCDDQAAMILIKNLISQSPEMARYIHIVCTGDAPRESSAIMAALFSNNDPNFDINNMPKIYCGSKYEDSIGKRKTTITSDMLIHPHTGEQFTEENVATFSRFVENLDSFEDKIIEKNKKIDLVILAALPQKGFCDKLVENNLIHTVTGQLQSTLSKTQDSKYEITGFNSEGWKFPALISCCEVFNIIETNITKGVKYNGDNLNSNHLKEISLYGKYMNKSALLYFEKMQLAWVFKIKEEYAKILANFNTAKNNAKNTSNSTQIEEFKTAANEVTNLIKDEDMPFINGSVVRVPTLHFDRLVTEVFKIPDSLNAEDIKNEIIFNIKEITKVFLNENENFVQNYCLYIEDLNSNLIYGSPNEQEYAVYEQIQKLQSNIREWLKSYIDEKNIGINIVLYDLGCTLYALNYQGLIDISDSISSTAKLEYRYEFSDKINTVNESNKEELGNILMRGMKKELPIPEENKSFSIN